MTGALSIPFMLHAQPDLVAVGLSAPAEAVSEHRISVSWTVESRGDGVVAASWYDRVYWSTNDTWDANDPSLDTCTRNQAIAAGSNYVATASFTGPTVMPGTYYLIARADAYDSLHETDEANNTVSRSIIITLTGGFRITAIETLANGRIRGGMSDHRRSDVRAGKQREPRGAKLAAAGVLSRARLHGISLDHTGHGFGTERLCRADRRTSLLPGRRTLKVMASEARL